MSVLNRNGTAAVSAAIVPVTAFLATSATLIAAIVLNTAGHFSYSLDDAYIHLALAERIAAGHYGINPGEITSPSSSILWPFLMVLGVGTRWHAFLPLVFNLVFGVSSAALMGAMALDLPWRQGQAGAAAAFAALFVFVANLPGLALTGMEHSLQVLLAAACAYGVAGAYRGRTIPNWCLAAAVIAPSVRYESLAITVVVTCALAGARRYRAAAAVMALSLVGPVLFALFLMAHGLPPLPNSVLAKTGGSAALGPLMERFATIAVAATDNASDLFSRVLVLFAAILFAGLYWREREPSRKWILAGCVAAPILHLLFGRVGWFYRYEVYMIAFMLLTLCAVWGRDLVQRWPTALALCALVAWPYFLAAYQTPGAAENIYEQQYQMHRFVQDYYKKNFAVNDLGWVSYRLAPSIYVLDLGGLASNAALNQRIKDAPWLDRVTREANAGLAIVYAEWLPDVPKSWTSLATMRLGSATITASESTVRFYATAVGNKDEIVRELHDFVPTLPAGVALTFDSSTPH